jgi:hypothetical protein
VLDKRKVVEETEYARVLHVTTRNGSILGQIQRQLWDRKRVESRSRATVAVATGTHVGVVGHITPEEFAVTRTDAQAYSGDLNRFLIAVVRRTQRLSAGGNVPEEILAHHGEQLRGCLARARRIGLMRRSADAQRLWATLYDELADDQESTAEQQPIVGAMISRAEAHSVRLQTLFAALDGQPEIDVPHVEAAAALWRYCRDSLSYVFGDLTHVRTADQILAQLRQSPLGLDRAAVFGLFNNKKRKEDIDPAVGLLIERGYAFMESEPTGGAPRQVLRLDDNGESANLTKEANEWGPSDVLSPLSALSPIREPAS